MKIDPDAVYLGDGGLALCGKHLGATARFTGYDLSGQEILEVTPRMLDELAGDGFLKTSIACETCGLRVHPTKEAL